MIRRRVVRGEDLVLIQQLIEREGARGRSHVSNRLCEIWGWRQANGRSRQIACRDLLCRLEARGLIALPPRLSVVRQAGYLPRIRTPELEQGARLQGALEELGDELSLRLAGDSEELAVYKGLVGTYHYLGYRPPSGAQLKYVAYCGDQPVAALSFGPAAWKTGPRDQFIGWTAQARNRNLPWVVNNDRFIILPWVQIQGLASFLLARAVHRLRRDWQRIYGQDLVLVESFVETGRFAGCAYAAANWICVGKTAGRGRNDRTFTHRAPHKSIWLYPLRRDFRVVLCQGESL